MKPNSITLMALDGNWLVHRAKHAGQNAPEEALPRIVARTVAGWAFKYAMIHRATHFFAAFDGPACFRNRVYSLYKANRKQVINESGTILSPEERDKLLLSGAKLSYLPDITHVCQEHTQALLGAYNVPMLQAKGYEADDYLASAAELASRLEVKKVVLVTKDKDALGSLRPKVEQWWPEPKDDSSVTITHADLSERLASYVHKDAAAWTPLQFRDYQILIGDSTDYVPDIVSSAHAREILNRYACLKDYFETRAGAKFYRAHQDALHRNFKLVVMRGDLLDDTATDVFKYKPLTQVPTDGATSVTRHMTEYAGLFKVLSRPPLFGPRK